MKTIPIRIAGLLALLMLTTCGTHIPAPSDDPGWLALPPNIAAEAVSYQNSNELHVAVRYSARRYSSDTKYSIHYGNTYLLEKAKELFEEQYPGWVVSIQPEGEITFEDYYVDGFDDSFYVHDYLAEERYYQTLPERLKEAGAPDVIGLNGADKERLTSEGLLLNLQPYIDLDRLLPPVHLNITKTGELYGVPVMYSMPTLHSYFNPEVLGGGSFAAEPDTWSNWTWAQAADYLEPYVGSDKPYQYFIGESPQRLTMYLINYNYSYIYDYELNRYHFDHPVFEETLQTVKELCQREWIWPATSSEKEDSAYHVDRYWSFFKELLYFKYLPFGIANFDTLRAGGGSNFVISPNMPSAEGMAIDIAGEYAVNAHSAKREAAVDFINILLSDELQNDVFIQFQPSIANVNIEGYSQAAVLFRKPNATEVANYNQRRQAFYSDVNRLYGANGAPYIMDIILKYTRAYYQNNASLHETIHYIQAEVDSYLHD